MVTEDKRSRENERGISPLPSVVIISILLLQVAQGW